MQRRCTHSRYISLEFIVFSCLKPIFILYILAKNDIEVIKRIQFIGFNAILAKVIFLSLAESLSF